MAGASKAQSMIGGGKRVTLAHEERRASKKHLTDVHIKAAPKKKGVVMTHDYASTGPVYEPSTSHPFGPGQHEQALAHLKKHVPYFNGGGAKEGSAAEEASESRAEAKAEGD